MEGRASIGEGIKIFFLLSVHGIIKTEFSCRLLWFQREKYFEETAEVK